MDKANKARLPGQTTFPIDGEESKKKMEENYPDTPLPAEFIDDDEEYSGIVMLACANRRTFDWLIDGWIDWLTDYWINLATFSLSIDRLINWFVIDLQFKN